MYLRRIYDWQAPAEQWSKVEELGRRPPVRAVEVLHAGLVQRFSRALVERAEREGWLTREQGCYRMATTEGPLWYRIVRGPGIYCCHCDARLEDWGGAPERAPSEARRHVLATHGDAISPDPAHPHGYRVEHDVTTAVRAGASPALSLAEASALERVWRHRWWARLREKYGETRDAALRRRAAKGA